MQDTPKRLCPFCAGVVSAVALLCKRCGQDLHSMKLAQPQAQPKSNLYEFVPDGQKFGIAIQGEIIVHGLNSADLETAQGYGPFSIASSRMKKLDKQVSE
jgi:hypothetical protein